jgi:citrate lyase beta subunit
MTRRQPVHVVYGGAHLFKPDIAKKLGNIALGALDKWTPTTGELDCTESVLERVREKLKTEPVEDYRIDFEDGYGVHDDEEEDLRLFLQTVSYRLPSNFRVTIPKVERPEEVAQLAMELRGRAWIEALVETPPIIGRLKELIDAAGGKLQSVHLGPYDLLASLGIAAPFQRLHHSACTSTRMRMLMAFAGTDVQVVDGPTKILPMGTDRDPVIAAWQQHRDEILLSLAEGFYQGWDLHPAQLVTRYSTLYHFYATHAPAMEARLKNYETAAETAVVMQRQFDDASTVRGLRSFLQRARDCHAIV